ncbi:fimbria/pilus outer membrane usher protein [Marinimicrobium alkaliphilum]|uniref:fimbria/pilus outer membrane usher protein n=1 Tax=Marinimicrobium alkaliphilum TaxID=2202654 RepID=UPI0018E0AB14|nr:fimbria/pilus outer membrane usher protein [Marinimicrobium alkaliphilum]
MSLSLAQPVAADPGSLVYLSDPELRAHWLPALLGECAAPPYFFLQSDSSEHFFIRQLDVRLLGIPTTDYVGYRFQGDIYHALIDIPYLRLDRRLNAVRIDQTLTENLCVSDLDIGDTEELLLVATVNQQVQGTVLLALITETDQLLLPVDALRQWRIKLPPPPYYRYDNEFYLPASQLTGTRHRLQRQQLTLALDIPAHWFVGSRPQLRQQQPSVQVRSDTGAFFNYDLNLEHHKPIAMDSYTHRGGLFELGLFNAGALLTQTGLYRETYGDGQWLRLETTLRHDNTERMTTLVVGDDVAETGSWGNRVRYGGVSWGTNFSTRPDLVTFPQPSMSGEAITASTVDVYIDNTRRARIEVPAGPFVIDDLPVITGAGNVQLITRDLLGRETVTSQPFYGSSALLRPGLYDYNLTAGKLRSAYGQESHQYEQSFASTTHRLGLTPWLTGELRAELSESLDVYGLATSISLAGYGMLHWSAAQSRTAAGTGTLQDLRLEHSRRHGALGVRGRITSDNFQQLGHTLAPQDRTHTYQAYASIRLGNWGALSGNYLERQQQGRRDEIVALGYSTRIAGAALNVHVSQAVNQSRDTQFRASLMVPLGRRISATSSLRASNNQQVASIGGRRSPDANGGFGFRANRYLGDRRDQELHTQWRTSVGSYRAAMVQRQSSEAYRANARGGLALLDRRVFASDWIYGSFAVVTTPGLQGLPVYRENLHVADTRRDGTTLVTGLRAFEDNRIRLDERDIPLNIQLENRERTPLVPGFRRGLVINFDLHKRRAAVLTLIDAQGQYLPTGAQVIADHSGAAFTVGWDGLTYIADMEERESFTVHWHSGRCRFTLEHPTESEDPLPELGTHVCTD